MYLFTAKIGETCRRGNDCCGPGRDSMKSERIAAAVNGLKHQTAMWEQAGVGWSAWSPERAGGSAVGVPIDSTAAIQSGARIRSRTDAPYSRRCALMCPRAGCTGVSKRRPAPPGGDSPFLRRHMATSDPGRVRSLAGWGWIARPTSSFFQHTLWPHPYVKWYYCTSLRQA